MTAAELSRLLFSPVLLVLYTSAMLAYLYAMAFGQVERVGVEGLAKGRRAVRTGTTLALLGVVAHVAHIAARAVASDRLPLGNMFEFSSVMALVVVVGGLVFVQRRMGRPELLGFVLLGALLTLGVSVLLYTEPGPLAPILDSWWRAIHVSTIVLGFGLLSLSAVFAGLQLVRDLAERRLAAQGVADRGGDARGAGGALPATVRPDPRPGTSPAAVDGGVPRPATAPARDVGTLATAAAPAPATARAAEADGVDGGDDAGAWDLDLTTTSIDQRVGKDRGDDAVATSPVLAQHRGLREATAQRWAGTLFPWRVALVTAVVAAAFSLVFGDPVATATFPLAAVAVVGLGWWAVPHLPAASELDKLTYRTTAFAFPILTFAIITGAIWAEQSWGRYWGWDPKETSAFVTWVAYAGYLHARATRGFRGRRAAWVSLGAFGILLFTYYGVNLVVSGLHSYAGL